MAEINGNENIIRYDDSEGMPWLLPSNVLLHQEACLQEKTPLRYQKFHHPKRHYSKSSAAAEPLHNSDGRSSQLRNQRTKNGSNTKWAFGGPGMQAVFLDSGRRSGGTGVFLPRRAGTHQVQSSNKPACPPVLLPSRVVQALSLNVHELGLQFKPQQDRVSKQSRAGGLDYKTRIGKKENIEASPEIFLPKEWTY